LGCAHNLFFSIYVNKAASYNYFYCMKQKLLFFILFVLPIFTIAQKTKLKILPAAFNLNAYLPLLKNKAVAVYANNTSYIGSSHLVDTLLKNNINIKKIFAPEHGFRGAADAGEKVDNSVDEKTKLPVISLYGKHNKPTEAELADVDILLFDIQDVGVRFYTYINSMQLYLEAAIENNKPLIILDRPNPNGHYVDGPILDTAYKTFIGYQPIPVVYGMTMGEYAQMLLGQKMLSAKANDAYQTITLSRYAKDAIYFSLQVIPCLNYSHKSMYALPNKPSPNLPNMQSVYLYPSTCFFEGTTFSLGRGTTMPFQVYGHPSLNKKLFNFKPISMLGAKEPPQKNNNCYGYNLTKAKIKNGIDLSYIINAFKQMPNKDSFFLRPNKAVITDKDYFFNKLAGNSILMGQLKMGLSEKEIKATWQQGIIAFKAIRKQYLLYPDFE
jgi:uncharacterized protein YbbC (DUF1343 family)